MNALRKIGPCAFVNSAESAELVFDVPVLVFRKQHGDLRGVIESNSALADQFIRLSILNMVARGLSSAQMKGIFIHQDLKPENILVDYLSDRYELKGDFPALIIPRINDFEIANELKGSRLRGFRPYLPAEHYRDFDNTMISQDNRYDIYSLAIIAHELLTSGYHPLMDKKIPKWRTLYSV